MFVLPGDRIRCIEEFEAGEGVYEENGELYASVAGKVVFEGKRVKIEPANKIPELRNGDVIIGRVIDVRGSIALIRFERKVGQERALAKSFVGVLHVSNVTDEFLKNMEDAVGFGDVVKAKIVEDLKLSIKGEDLGVVKAKCKCGNDLVLDGDKLKCPKCGNVESRKISADYGRCCNGGKGSRNG